MALTSKQKELLNKFSDSQPALRDKELPFSSSALPLGDLLAEAGQGPKLMKATYSHAVHGGTIGTKVLATLPAGAKLTGRLWTDARAAMTSGGSATVAIEAGATVLLAATAFNDAALTGFDAQASFTPMKLATDSPLELVIAAAALTAGVVDIYVEYIP